MLCALCYLFIFSMYNSKQRVTKRNNLVVNHVYHLPVSSKISRKKSDHVLLIMYIMLFKYM